jgi:hypothetical protein
VEILQERFFDVNIFGHFWSSESTENSDVYYLSVECQSSLFAQVGAPIFPTIGSSIRFVKDEYVFNVVMW